jgi:hypothetical protein
MEIINEVARQLPWPVHPDKRPCQPWRPSYLWDIGSLRKAIFNELACVKGTIELMEKSTNCLEHILRCWEMNLREQECAGPAFLIHCLESRYKDNLRGLRYLKHPDAWKAIVLAEACHRSQLFQFYVARFHRTAVSTLQIVGMTPGQTTGAMQVQSTSCWLENIMHISEQHVTLVPGISEEDLLNEYHFEDDVPDSRVDDRDRIIETWIRPVSC